MLTTGEHVCKVDMLRLDSYVPLNYKPTKNYRKLQKQIKVG